MPFESRGSALHRGCIVVIDDCTQPPPHIVELEVWREALELLHLEPHETTADSAAALEQWAKARSAEAVVDGLTSVRFYDEAAVEELRRGGFPAEQDLRALWFGAALVARLFPAQFQPVSGSRLVVQLFHCGDHGIETDDPDRLHDFCVRMLRDAEPANGPLARRYTDAAVYGPSMPRSLRQLLGVQLLDRLVVDEPLPARHADSWWARDDAFAITEPSRTITTLEIHTHLAYPRSMVDVPFDSGAC